MTSRVLYIIYSQQQLKDEGKDRDTRCGLYLGKDRRTLRHSCKKTGVLGVLRAPGAVVARAGADDCRCTGPGAARGARGARMEEGDRSTVLQESWQQATRDSHCHDHRNA